MADVDPFRWVGGTVGAKYRVDEAVGARGLGVVYRGLDTSAASSKNWAVEITCMRMPAGLDEPRRAVFFSVFSDPATILPRLSREANGGTRAISAGVATAPDGVRAPYIVRAWLEGESLEHAKKKRATPYSLRDAIALLEPAAKALAEAHDANLVHRDVTPANLFLLKDGGLVVLDFGIAQALDEVTGSAKVSGFSGAYAAPELFNSSYGAVGPWTDVFALTLVLVELVAGRRALSASETADAGELYLAASDLKARPTLRALGIDAPPNVDAVLAKALAVDPKRRYDHARAMWSALRDAMSSASLAPQMHTKPRKKRTIPLAPIYALLAIVAFVGIGLWITHPKDTPSVAPVASLSFEALTVTVDASVRDAGTMDSGDAGATAATGPDPDASAVVLGMVLVPAADFDMGRDAIDERPAHHVKITRAFYMDANEVTTEEYEACFAAHACARNTLHSGDEVRPDQGACNTMQFPDRAKNAVNCVDHDQAEAYCASVHKRLPTEAEWELAARGTDGRAFPWGDDPPTTCAMAIVEHMDGACASHIGTWDVGTTSDGKSPFGAFDMAGNVWEWVSDGFAHYTKDDATDPAIPLESHGRGILRGGAWSFPAGAARTTFRLPFQRQSTHAAIGFRCAKSANEEPRDE